MGYLRLEITYIDDQDNSCRETCDFNPNVFDGFIISNNITSVEFLTSIVAGKLYNRLLDSCDNVGSNMSSDIEGQMRTILRDEKIRGIIKNG